MPTAGNPLSPDQSQDASTVGWLSAATQLANMSAPHFAYQSPASTPLQLITQGLGAYGAGVNNYTNNINAQNTASGTANSAVAKGQMDQLAANRALNYFYPGKGNALPAALASTNMAPTVATGSSPSAPTAGGVTTPIPGDGSPITAPQVNASAIQPPPSPTSLSSFYGGTPSATTTPAGGTQQIVPSSSVAAQATSMGMTVPQTAKALYDAGMAQMMLGQPGGSDLVSQAIKIDPTIVQTDAAATAQGQLPSELTKIAATGAQARQTATTEAGLRPHDQQVMINGTLYTIPSNDAAAATGAVPLGLPAGTSTQIPASAKSASEAQGKNLAEAQDAQSLLDSRMQNAMNMIKQMKDTAPQTFQGHTGKLAEAISDEGFGVGPIKPWSQSNAAQTKFEQLNSNLFTQELPGIIKGAGGRIDIPLLNAIKEAGAIDPYAPHATKVQALDNLTDILTKAQQNASRNTSNLSNAAGIAAPSAATGWSVTPIK